MEQTAVGRDFKQEGGGYLFSLPHLRTKPDLAVVGNPTLPTVNFPLGVLTLTPT